MEQCPGFNKFQSAYRRGHSTETALLRLLNDVYTAADNKTRSLLVLLDLSSAFDTIDISTLIRRVENTYGITGTALQWLQSYVNKRSQFVSVGGVRSKTVNNQFGIPQGSCLGPCLFS
ncbi:MAG TPA: reverse transcriptase domain-containing protein, partial [Methylomicrobium sp.]|nr:reverse transcriptase domain-containing protein [Methylomicrobium sp.]